MCAPFGSVACARVAQTPIAAAPIPTFDAAPAAATPSSADNEAQTRVDASPAGSASRFLERALDALQAGRPATATANLRAALATGDLNDAGRTLVYWYIYVAMRAEGRQLGTKDALADFVAVAEDVLGVRERVRYAEHNGNDFVDRFDVKGRLARARALLNLAWSHSHRSFGRSAEQAIVVHSETELHYFLQLAAPCEAPRAQRIAKVEDLPATQFPVRRIDCACGPKAARQSFFFEWHGQHKTQIWPGDAGDATVAQSAP